LALDASAVSEVVERANLRKVATLVAIDQIARQRKRIGNPTPNTLFARGGP